MKLHSIIHTNHSNLWCGPAAIASITGLDTRTVHECARDVCRRAYIKGMYDDEVLKVLRALGYTGRIYHKGRWMTLTAWMVKYRSVFSKRPAILAIKLPDCHHYVTLLGSQFIDSSLKNPVPLKRASHKQGRVMHFMVVEKL